LLANRIALLKQEEMKTWKKIEETKKRTNDISGLKKRNEEKVQKVSKKVMLNMFVVENFRYPVGKRAEAPNESKQLHDVQVEVRRKEKSPGCSDAPEEGGGQAVQNGQAAERGQKKTKQFPS
jgi:hypothetical protein